MVARRAGNYVQELQLPPPLLLIGSTAVILTAAILASVMPAARAARVGDVEALLTD